jgi:hypothetical protein
MFCSFARIWGYRTIHVLFQFVSKILLLRTNVSAGFCVFSFGNTQEIAKNAARLVAAASGDMGGKGILRPAGPSEIMVGQRCKSEQIQL